MEKKALMKNGKIILLVVGIIFLLVITVPVSFSVDNTFEGVKLESENTKNYECVDITIEGTYVDYVASLFQKDYLDGYISISNVDGMSDVVWNGVKFDSKGEGTLLGKYVENEFLDMGYIRQKEMLSCGVILLGSDKREPQSIIVFPATTREEALELANSLFGEMRFE